LAVRINSYIHEEKPGVKEFPTYSEIWIMLLGGLVCYLWEHASKSLTYKWFEKYTKGDGDPELKKFYTNKACHTFW
jgi:hypothetical protein